MLKSKIEMRETAIEDAKDLYEWRCDKLTQMFSFNSSEFSFSDHCRWLKRKIGSENNLLLTGYVDGWRVGLVRFEVEPSKQTAWISINVNPKFRGKGLSNEMLRRSLQIFRSKYSEKVIAKIMIGNKISAQAFRSAGFERLSVSDGVIVFGHD